MLAEFEKLCDLQPLLRLHLLEDFTRTGLRQVAQQVGGRVRVHLLDDVGGAGAVERFEDGHLDVRIDFLERLGRDLLVDRLEDRLALGGRQILDDVGDIGRVDLRQPLVGDFQLDASSRVGLEEIDELPGDDPRRNLLQQGAEA